MSDKKVCYSISEDLVVNLFAETLEGNLTKYLTES